MQTKRRLELGAAPGAVAWYLNSDGVRTRASLPGLPSPSPCGRAIDADHHGSPARVAGVDQDKAGCMPDALSAPA